MQVEKKVQTRDDMLQCEVCQKMAVLRCGGCHRIYYCHKEHQREHWKVHKNICRPFKIFRNENAIYLVASRRLYPNDVVLKELPLIWAPSFSSPEICLGCAKILDATHQNCTKCGWAVCNDLCEKSPAHLPECKYSVQRGERIKATYQTIILLRYLYYKKFLSKSWKVLEKLEHNWKTQSAKLNFTNKTTSIAEFTRRLFKLFSVSVQDLVKIYEIVMSNYQEPKSEIIALYENASLLEHNCSPNCAKLFEENGEIVIKAVREIKEGETISISYINSLLGTPSRRSLLYKKRFFWCCCERCKDPTEFGTNFSALKCQSIYCNGLILPKSFTSLEKRSDWICGTCRQIVAAYYVMDILERIENDMNELNNSNIENCKIFLNSYKSFLHENHYFCVQIKYTLSQLLNEEIMENVDVEMLAQICQNLEDLIQIIAPNEILVLQNVKVIKDHLQVVKDM